jgi:hypothetical protein
MNHSEQHSEQRELPGMPTGVALWRHPGGTAYRVNVTGWHETAMQRFAEVAEETAFGVHGDQLDFAASTSDLIRALRWDGRRAEIAGQE